MKINNNILVIILEMIEVQTIVRVELAETMAELSCGAEVGKTSKELKWLTQDRSVPVLCRERRGERNYHGMCKSPNSESTLNDVLKGWTANFGVQYFHLLNFEEQYFQVLVSGTSIFKHFWWVINISK